MADGGEPTLRLDDFVPYRLSVASNLVSDVIATAYEALFHIQIPQWRIVAVLAERPGSTPLELTQRTRMDKMTVSRAAAQLSARRLVERSPNPRDRRSHRLALTADGRTLYAQVAPVALALEARLLAVLTPGEVEAFVGVLGRLEAAAAGLVGAPDRTSEE